MTGVPTVLALVSGRVEQKLVAEGTEDDLVELPLDKLVTVHLVHLVLAFADGALTAQSTSIQRTFSHILLDCGMVSKR